MERRRRGDIRGQTKPPKRLGKSHAVLIIFTFPFPIQFSIYSTTISLYIHAVREYVGVFFRRPNNNFFGSINILLSTAVLALLSGNLPRLLSFGLEVYSHNEPH